MRGFLSHRHWALLGFALLLIGALSLQYMQDRYQDESVFISLANMRVEQDSSMLHLTADAQLNLPPTVQAGLDSGVPLTFVLEFAIRKPKRFLPDKTVVKQQRHFTLTYYELTRHYRVESVELNISRNYRSVTSALAGLGRLEKISIDLDDQQQEMLLSEGLEGILSMRLSKSALPLPLQPIIRSSWTLASKEYRWQIT